MSLHFALAWIGVAEALPPLEIEAGLISSHTPMVASRALRAGARTELGSLGLTTSVLVRPSMDSGGLADLTHTLVAIANEGSGQVGFQQPVNFESAALQVLVDWDFGQESRPSGISGGMRVYGGAQAGLVQSFFASYDPSITTGPPTILVASAKNMAMGPVLGVGYETWFDGVVGLHFGALYRGYLVSPPQYDPDVAVSGSQLEAGWTTYANLVFGLGGAE